MRDRIIEFVIVVLLFITIPYIMTFILCGRTDSGTKLSKIESGRDVIVHIDGKNKLIDVEQYIAGVLPNIVSPDSNRQIMEAQAVAVRTNIYYTMGKETVIDEDKLEYDYLSEKEARQKLGGKTYSKYKSKYEDAVLKTVGHKITNSSS